MTTSDATKKDSFGTVFWKKILPKGFLKYGAKKVLCTLEYIFNKVDRGTVEKSDAVVVQYCPGRWLLQSKTNVSCSI